MDDLAFLIGLVTIFVLWILPMMMAYRLCLLRHRSPAGGVIFTLFLGMRKSTIGLLAMSVILTGCNPQKTSWVDKQIQSFGFVEQNKQEDISERIKKQKACEEYGISYWGETYKINGEQSIIREYRYSPRFDKCFMLRTMNSNGATQISIVDVLSAKSSTLNDFQSSCRDIWATSPSRFSPEEMEEHCPSERNIKNLWLSLLGESSS